MTETERLRDGKTVTESIADEVKRLRTEEELSLTAIAARLGVSKATVSAAAQITGTEFSAASTRTLTEAVIGGARLRRAKMAAEALATAEEPLSKAKAASDATEAKGWSVVFGVMIDKSLSWRVASTPMTGRRSRPSTRNGSRRCTPICWISTARTTRF
ncbi:hypothetical protein [Nocardia farcinica]